LGPGFFTDSNALTAMERNMKNVVFKKSIMDEVFDLEILPDFEMLLPQGAKLGIIRIYLNVSVIIVN
jgi:hypothetical protein